MQSRSIGVQLELDVGVHVCLWMSLYSHSITIIIERTSVKAHKSTLTY